MIRNTIEMWNTIDIKIKNKLKTMQKRAIKFISSSFFYGWVYLQKKEDHR